MKLEVSLGSIGEGEKLLICVGETSVQGSIFVKLYRGVGLSAKVLYFIEIHYSERRA